MRLLKTTSILIFVSFSVIAKSFPLYKNGAQTNFSPDLTNKKVDLSSSLEIFYNYRFIFLRGIVFNQTFENVNIQNEIFSGFAFKPDEKSQWFLGMGTQVYNKKINKTNLIQLNPAFQILYFNEDIKTYFQMYVNGYFSWGACLYSAFFIPIEISTQYDYFGYSDLKFNVTFVLLDQFKAGVFYRFFGEYAGMEISGIFKSQIHIYLIADHNFTKYNDSNLSGGFIYYFNESKENKHEEKSSD
ncbi:MAG: hypothetical protein OEV78_12230 [Spirochaetia bacterium]|nr:hypothetical protein [Spirochaetia bacterium]